MVMGGCSRGKHRPRPFLFQTVVPGPEVEGHECGSSNRTVKILHRPLEALAVISSSSARRRSAITEEKPSLLANDQNDQKGRREAITAR